MCEILLDLLSKLRQVDLQALVHVLLLASFSLAQLHPAVQGCQPL